MHSPSSPLAEKTSKKGLITAADRPDTMPEIESTEPAKRISEIVLPISLRIDFASGVGYAGGFPQATHPANFPGSEGGSFFWLSVDDKESGSGEVNIPSVSTRQPIYLHRLKIDSSEAMYCQYSCRRVTAKASSPTMNWFKRLLSAPARTAIHPQATMQELRQAKAENISLLPDLQTGDLETGLEPQPVIWSGKLNGQATVIPFDAKSLQTRPDSPWIQKSSFEAVSQRPVSDYCTGKYMVLARTHQQAGRYSRFLMVLLYTGRPKIAAFMAPHNLDLNFFGGDDNWMVCFANQDDRLLVHLISRKHGSLVAVYQTAHMPIKKVVRLDSQTIQTQIRITVLLEDGGVNRIILQNLTRELARFDGSAGLLTHFPIAEYERLSDGPFEQVFWFGSGYYANTPHALFKLNSKFCIDASWSNSRTKICDSLMLPMENGAVCVVLASDMLTEAASLQVIDMSDMNSIASIPFPHQITRPSSLFYLYTRQIE